MLAPLASFCNCVHQKAHDSNEATDRSFNFSLFGIDLPPQFFSRKGGIGKQQYFGNNAHLSNGDCASSTSVEHSWILKSSSFR